MKLKPITVAIATLIIALVIGFMIIKRNSANNSKLIETPELATQSRDLKTNTSEPRASNRPIRGAQPEDKIPAKYSQLFDHYLGGDRVSNEEAADGLLAIAVDSEPPLQVRIDAMEHALNLIDDRDFIKVADLMSSLPESLVQTIFDDSYNRDHLSQVETAYRIISENFSRTLTDEAKEHLEFHLEPEPEEDTETWDIAKWTKAVENYRQQSAQPVEEEIIEEVLDQE